MNGTDGVEAWLQSLPRLVGDLLDQWQLTEDGPAVDGDASLLVPVAGERGQAVLRVAWPRPETADAHRALGVWGGQGAVRMLAADPGRGALLLERLEPRDLNGPGVGIIDACETIGHLARTLDRPAPPWLKNRASEALHALVDGIDAVRASGGAGKALPRRLLEQGRARALELAAEPGVDARLVHGDLHPESVLWRPSPGEWVATAPHPIAADPTWAVAPTLWHRWADATAAHDLRTHLNFRLDLICDAAGLDPDRARVVSELRVLSNAVGDLVRGAPGLTERLTRHVTIIKALQPA